MRYAVIIERGENSYGAYVPDLSGCIAVGDTPEEAKILIQSLLEFHLEGLQEDGESIPKPSSSIEYIEAKYLHKYYLKSDRIRFFITSLIIAIAFCILLH